MLNTMKTSTITSKGQIVIPSELRERKEFKPGKQVVILEYEDHLEIRPFEAVAKKIDFEEERKRGRGFLKKFVEKHPHLKNIKKWELTPEEKDELARHLYQ